MSKFDHTWIPGKGDKSQRRIKEVTKEQRIVERAVDAGRNGKPDSDDQDLDEHQRMLQTVSSNFIATIARSGASDIGKIAEKISGKLPKRLEKLLELAAAGQQVAETKARYGGDLDRANVHRQRSLGALRTFEKRNGLDAFSGSDKNDKAMFGASLLALTIAEGGFNAFSFEQMQDQGLLGGLVLATTVSVTNVLMGVGAGWLGWRLMAVPIPAISISRSDASRSGIPGDREQCGAGRVTAPSGMFADLSVRLSRQVRRRPSP